MPRSPWWPATAALGLALAPALAGGIDRYGQAGLAWLVIAGLGAALIGVPLAQWEWRQSRKPSTGRLPRMEQGLARILAVLLVGATLGPAAATAGLTPWVAIALLTGSLLSRLQLPWVLAGAMVPAVALATGGVQLGEIGPWTLLEPRWDSIGTWGPRALVVGVLFAAPGLGIWTRVRDAVPGWRPTVWLPVGASLLAATAAAVLHGIQVERLATGQLAWVGLVGGLAAATALLTGVGEQARWQALGLACSTVWFAGPGLEGTTVLWTATAPGVLALVLASRGWRVREDRALLWAAAAAIGCCAAAGWPGLPESAGASAGVALIWVGLVWGAGTWSIAGKQ